jgi:hypothetical protein
MDEVKQHKVFLYEFLKHGNKHAIRKANPDQISILIEILHNIEKNNFNLSEQEGELLRNYLPIIHKIITAKGS